MNPDIKDAANFGFYFLRDESAKDEKSAYGAFYRSCRNRLLSPGIASSAFVVRYSGLRGRYNDVSYIDTQYVYASIYDAMRQIKSFFQEEYEGEIELLLYTDESGMKTLRKWEYNIEGYRDSDGSCVIESSGWDRAW
ncbi:hypothetical protein b3_0189 [Synechococcus phage B3]|nr:hypothetical protein b3_0189 [Synechococcus phage B3]QGT54803.1 hypothetical protein b23_0188 [Synechococcus phage B23]